MKNIILKENSVYDLIFSGAEKNKNTLNKINILISQKENTFKLNKKYSEILRKHFPNI